MIKSFNDYIEFLDKYPKSDIYENELKKPGEHHFVSTYLLPKIISFAEKVPQYVNPDGMKKNLPGDILYYNNEGKCILSIEIKYSKIEFQKSQYINWINPKTRKLNHPMYLLAFIGKEILIIEWIIFAEIYNEFLKGKQKFNSNKEKFVTPSIPIQNLKKQNKDLFVFNSSEKEEKFNSKLEEILIKIKV